MVVNYQIESTPLSSIIANLNQFATLPTTSIGAGEIIHYTGDNTIRWNSQTVDPTTDPTWSELGDSVWEDSGTLVTLTTPRDVDLEGKRLYLKKEASEALSTYIEVDGTSGNLVFHIPSGEAVEWQVG